MNAEPHPIWPAVERGHGRPVVFLHGYPLNHAIWEPQLDAFSPSYEVALLDLPGYGLAQEWPVPETLAGFAESVHHALKQRFPMPVVIVGHSFGGYVALEMFRNHPERFEGLVLADTRSEPDAPEAKAKRLALAERLEDPSQNLEVEETVRGLLAPATWDGDGPVPEIVRGIVRSVRSSTIIPTLRAIAGRPDLTPLLASIPVPTLVIWGEEDRLIPPAQSRSMIGQLKSATGVGVPGAGHLPSLEAPAGFERPLREFLEQLPPP